MDAEKKLKSFFLPINTIKIIDNLHDKTGLSRSLLVKRAIDMVSEYYKNADYKV